MNETTVVIKPGALDQKNAAAYLNVGTTWFRENIVQPREVRQIPFGGLIRYAVKDLDAYIERQARKTA